jgi:glutathione S-transferase
MTYQLYGGDGSGSGIVEMALAEIGAGYELQPISLKAKEQRAAAYARLNPQRKLPTLIRASGEVLSERAAVAATERLLRRGSVPGRAQPLGPRARVASQPFAQSRGHRARAIALRPRSGPVWRHHEAK